jgi:spermidine/putrescine transport system substrate-binding protein
MSTHTSVPSQRAIRFLCWNDYVHPDCLTRFTSETGIAVERIPLYSDDECLRRIKGGEPIDVVLNTNYSAEVLINLRLVRPLSLDLLPNFAHATDRRFGAPAFDPGSSGVKYTTVNYWGSLGFAVRLDAVARPVNSWRMLFNEEYAGRITMCGDAREVFAPALFLLGSDCNCTDRAIIDEATQMLIAQRRLVSVYSSDDEFGMLVDRGNVIVQCWNGDVALALKRGETGLAFMLPHEGYDIWMDAPFIPVSARDPEAAHLLLDFLMRPDVAAQNADFSGYPPAIPAADELLKSLIQRSLRPLDAQLTRGVFQRDLGPLNQVYEEAFRKVLAS